MNVRKDVFAAIDSLEEEYINHWEALCNLESPTEDKAAVDRAGEYLASIAKEKGWKIEKHEEPVSGDVWKFTLNPDAPGRPVVFSGHLDTVHPAGLFGEPAVRVDREEGIIYGPGVMDCKGGVVASILAMDALIRVGFCGRPVIFLAQSDEEVSSRFSEKRTVGYMCEQAKDAVAFLNTEGRKNGKIVVERKGISRYRLTVHGKASHASLCMDGVSAVCEASHKIIELEKYKDRDGMTCSCGLISGGTAENSVPEVCTFTVDLRFKNRSQMEEGDRVVREVANHSYLAGTTCDVTLASRRVAMERVEKNLLLADKINAVFEAYGLETLVPDSSTGGSDAADTTAYGIPTVDNLGTSGGYIHSKREYSCLASLADSAKRLASVAVSLEE